jgi:acetyl esterase/lipase
MPADSSTDHLLPHNHSDGGVTSSMFQERKAVGHLAKAAGSRALAINFRLAPENKFPSQIDDVEAAYRWLLEVRPIPDREHRRLDRREPCVEPGADPTAQERSAAGGGSVHVAGEYELFVDDAKQFAEQARSAGVDLELRSLPEGQHNFFLGAGRVPEIDAAVKEVGGWLRSKFGLAVASA